ncbi:MAG: antitoxin family protein [Acidobacteria bacterium]|nr:antitoxin family protein [Acidobacteriota bacterium]
MTKQLEVIYEDGVLRPLQPLPFADKQRLIVTVTSEASPGLAYNPRKREMEWLRVNAAQHAGRYVAVEGDQLVGEGDSVKSVMEQARARGVPLPLVVHIPKEPELPFAGW